MVFFPQDLRLVEYDNDAVLYEDATLTLVRWDHIDAVRFIGSFLRYAPSREGQLSVARDIVGLREPIETEYRKVVGYAVRTDIEWTHGIELPAACQAVQQLVTDLTKLSDHYNKAILQPFIGVKKPDIPLNPSWDNNTIIADAQRASRKDMRKEIIARDVYRCCVTGRLDVDVADLEPVEKATVLSEGPYVPGNLDTLQVAHVFPYSINKFDASNNVHSQRAKIIWTAFRNFSGFDLSDLLGAGINGGGNLFMLSPVAHRLYDRLELWFNPLEGHVMSHEIEIAECYGDLLNTLGKVKLDNRVDWRWLAIHRSMCLISQHNKGFRDEAFELKAEQPDDEDA